MNAAYEPEYPIGTTSHPSAVASSKLLSSSTMRSGLEMSKTLTRCSIVTLQESTAESFSRAGVRRVVRRLERDAMCELLAGDPVLGLNGEHIEIVGSEEEWS